MPQTGRGVICNKELLHVDNGPLNLNQSYCLLDSLDNQHSTNKKNINRTSSVTKTRPPKILLVEDEPIGQIIGKGLLDDLGCDSTIVGTAIDALKCFLEHDLVLLDLGLPDIEGCETCTLMRTQNTAIPIIAYTSLMDGEGMRSACYAAGFDDYLEKPVGIKHIYSTLLKYLPKKLVKKLRAPE